MVSGTPTDAERVAPNFMDTTPENQAATFRNQDQTWPVRAIGRGEAVRPLPAHGRSLADLTFEVGDVRVSLDEFMARRRTAGLLVLKNGEVALERYGLGNGPQSLWTGFGTAAAITGTLVGAALHEGAIGGLDDPCDLYLPALAGSGYEGVTVRNALRMCSGVAWSEDHLPGGRAADAGRLGRAMASRRPGAILDLVRNRPAAHPQGAVYNYSTGESCLLGAVVVAATGRWLADYCSEAIWGPGGMEADGHWQLDCDDGMEIAGLGVSACLRDLGRFGQLVLEDGEAFGGRRVLPVGWRDLAGQPDCAATAHGAIAPGSPAGYGYQWWALPGAPYADGLHAGAFASFGAFGQRLYVNPAERVVAVIQSAWRQPVDGEAELESVMMLRAAVRALRPEATS
jgi:CubicO group peptidase (beta-lactamase class C family)